MAKTGSRYAAENAEIISRLDVIEEYRLLGVQFNSDTPRPNGYIECFAVGRDDAKPSGAVNVNSGRYSDSATGENLSIFDFAVRHGGQPDPKAARRYFAERAGVSLGSSRKPVSPEDLLEFCEWAAGEERLAERWCAAVKKGVSMRALKLAGARIAFYPCWVDKKTKEKRRGKNKVVALPVYGPELINAEPCGWVVFNITGAPLEVYRGPTKPLQYVKMKTVGGSQSGLMNLTAISRMGSGQHDETLVFKVEGPTDMLAALSVTPDEMLGRVLVTCNSGGGTEDVKDSMLSPFAGRTVAVLQDADQPGEIGAAKWCVALNGVAAEVRHVKLPYPVAENHGKDLRDWLNEGHGLADILELYGSVEPWQLTSTAKKATSTDFPVDAGDEDPNERAKREMPVEYGHCQLLRIDVLGEVDGKVKVFSHYHGKTEVLGDVGRMSYSRLLQLAGPTVKQRVTRSKEDVPGMMSLDDARDAIAGLAGYNQIGEETELGAGCWIPHADRDALEPHILAVGYGEAAAWNGSVALHKIPHPRYRGSLLDFGAGGNPWYQFEHLENWLIKAKDRDWCAEVQNELITLLQRWRWKNKESPLVVAGLILATWVQTVWGWRPQVAITGASKAGKTTLFDLLTGLYGELSVKSSKSSAAGIRQAIASSAKVVLCDEFENSRHREEFLEMLRASGAGDSIYRGTTGHTARRFGLRHMVWVGAIEVGIKREPDRNRFIMLELLPALDGDRGKLSLPSSSELRDIGQKALAVAITHAPAARRLAAAIKSTKIAGIDQRLIESYGVPASLLASIEGSGETGAIDLLETLTQSIEVPDGVTGDESDLIYSILSSDTTSQRDTYTIAQLIEIVDHKMSGADDAIMALGRCGLKIDRFNSADEGAVDGEKCLAIAFKSVQEHLFKYGSPWVNQNIETILQRIPGAMKARRRVGAQRPIVILIPWSYLKNEHLGDREGYQRTFS